MGAFAAAAHQPGVNPYDEAMCLQAIRNARVRADWVWVFLHWGNEFVRFPDAGQRRAARRMIEAGASLVVGGHTHVRMGAEHLTGGHIFYGLGNFIYPGFRENRGYSYRYHPMGRRGLALRGQLVGGAWSWQAIPVRQDLEGLPSVDVGGRCLDYGQFLPESDTWYERMHRVLRSSERLVHITQRAMFMSFDERRFRLRRLLGLR